VELKGTVRGGVVELDPDVRLRDGTRVYVVLDDTPGSEDAVEDSDAYRSEMRAWLESARELRARLPATSDSSELLRGVRDGLED
jgi:hypothetical protein